MQSVRSICDKWLIVVAPLRRYCKRVYDAKDPSKSGIFLTLLKVYLRPTQQQRDSGTSQHVSPAETPSAPLFAPALALLSTQGTRMDTDAALDLLPPLVTVRDVRVFLGKSIRRSVWTARMDGVARTLVDLEGRRVKITDGRLCPLCRKRLGNSVIAVHSPGWVHAAFSPSRSLYGLAGLINTHHLAATSTEAR